MGSKERDDIDEAWSRELTKYGFEKGAWFTLDDIFDMLPRFSGINTMTAVTIEELQNFVKQVKENAFISQKQKLKAILTRIACYYTQKIVIFDYNIEH